MSGSGGDGTMEMVVSKYWNGVKLASSFIECMHMYANATFHICTCLTFDLNFAVWKSEQPEKEIFQAQLLNLSRELRLRSSGEALMILRDSPIFSNTQSVVFSKSAR